MDAGLGQGWRTGIWGDKRPGEWVNAGHAVLITGAGRFWLACALAQHACRRGHSALYQRVPRLGEELRIRHANGTLTRWLDTLKNTDVLLLDDWGMTTMDGQTRADLLEIIDDRASQRATIHSPTVAH
jgi:DNA replication protein DnaC